MGTIDFLVQVTTLPDDLKPISGDRSHALYQTYEIYQYLIDSTLLWRVWQIDEYGKLWLEVNRMSLSGEPEFHTIALDEGTYQQIEFEPYAIIDERSSQQTTV